MKRSKPLSANPEKARAWQQRGVEKYRERQKQQAGNRPRTSRKRATRNDSGWRNDVIARIGGWCRSCRQGDASKVQIDHIWPRGQGGPSHVLNGLPLCGPYGCNAHERKTNSEIVIEYDWLDDEQRAWLDDNGWVRWNDDGAPEGRGMRHFGHRRVENDDA